MSICMFSDIRGSSDEISERLQQCRKQALARKDELEAERQEVHQAACKVINVLNDTMEVQCLPSQAGISMIDLSRQHTDRG